MNNAVFGKTMENLRQHRDIKLVATDRRRNQLAPEANYHITKYFSENLMAIKPKYREETKLCYMDPDSFVIHIKTKDFYEDISDDVEKWFDTSNYDEHDK